MPALTPIQVYKGEPAQVLLESSSALNAIIPVYTVGTGKRLIIKYIRITNLFKDEFGDINIKSGTSATASNGDFILRSTQIEPGNMLVFEMNEIINANEKLFVWQGDSSVAVHISGIEVTL
jgi:hypothetical protein